MKENILVLEGHPATDSFCAALASAVREGAESSGATVRHLRLSDLDFQTDLMGEDPREMPLEPDLQAVWDALTWCDRVVIVHPLWWGSAPAKLKGLFDRVLRSGHAYEYQKGKPLPTGLLKGRKAQALITSDTPTWYLRLAYRSAWQVILRKQILGFCGLQVGGIHNLGPIKSSTGQQREKFLERAYDAGRSFS